MNTAEMKRQFTLIELLVVVSIIAILASLLLPALSKAKEKAREVSCIGHLKNLGTALQMYANDSDDFFPPLTYRPALNNPDAFYVDADGTTMRQFELFWGSLIWPTCMRLKYITAPMTPLPTAAANNTATTTRSMSGKVM